MKKLWILLSTGIWMPLFLSAQTQWVRFDSTVLNGLQEVEVSKEESKEIAKEHKTIAILPAAVEQFKGYRKPFPLEAQNRSDISYKIQELVRNTILTSSKKYQFHGDIQPLIRTNYVLDSLWGVMPTATQKDIFKALNVDAVIIPRYTINRPQTGNYIGFAASVMLSIALGTSSNARVPETTTDIIYWVKDCSTSKIICKISQTQDWQLVNPESDKPAIEKLNSSILRFLPYMERQYKIKNQKTRKVVKLSSCFAVTFGILYLLSRAARGF